MDAIETHWDVRSAIYLMHRSIAGSGATVLIGDSITEGFYWNKIGGCSIVNAGFGGIGVEGIVRYLPTILQGGAPSFVIILLGANDTKGLMSRAAFEARYTTIVDTFRKEGATVVVVSIPPLEPEKLKGINRNENLLVEFNQAIREIAETRDVEYVDLYSQLVGRPGITTDGIHFSVPSYQTFYQMMDEALRAQVVKTGKPC